MQLIHKIIFEVLDKLIKGLTLIPFIIAGPIWLISMLITSIVKFMLESLLKLNNVIAGFDSFEQYNENYNRELNRNVMVPFMFSTPRR